MQCCCLDIWNPHQHVFLWQGPFLSLPVKREDWEQELSLNSRAEPAFSRGDGAIETTSAASGFPSPERPCWCCRMDIASLHHLQPLCLPSALNSSPVLLHVAMLQCWIHPRQFGAQREHGGPGRPGGRGWAGGHSSWRAIPDSRQVDGAAGGQHQTGGRWRGRREGNTTLYSTWH